MKEALFSTYCEHAAEGSGFDLDRGVEGVWRGFESTQVPLRVWIRAEGESFVIALSQSNVAHTLADEGIGSAVEGPLPAGASAARYVATRPLLHALLRRAFGLSRTLPKHLAESFAKRVATMPRTTEAERLVVQRVGQDLFRDGLLDYWQGRCAVTGLAVPQLLRASHMKPWAKCATDDERLDVFNGVLLAANLDAAFDAGLVTFDDEGAMVCSPTLPQEARSMLGWNAPLRLRRIEAAHRGYLGFHREHEFKKG